jgi:hypothetical protein
VARNQDTGAGGYETPPFHRDKEEVIPAGECNALSRFLVHQHPRCLSEKIKISHPDQATRDDQCARKRPSMRVPIVSPSQNIGG